MKALPKIKVSNMESPRTGTPVANQFVIDTPEMQIFQSYSTVIAIKTFGYGKTAGLVLDEDAWEYSVTTAKYRNIFTGLTTKETRDRVKSGEIRLAKLN